MLVRNVPRAYTSQSSALDDNFIMGCARLEYTGKDTAKVMDTVGGVMYVEYKNGEVRECQK